MEHTEYRPAKGSQHFGWHLQHTNNADQWSCLRCSRWLPPLPCNYLEHMFTPRVLPLYLLTSTISFSSASAFSFTHLNLTCLGSSHYVTCPRGLSTCQFLAHLQFPLQLRPPVYTLSGPVSTVSAPSFFFPLFPFFFLLNTCTIYVLCSSYRTKLTVVVLHWYHCVT